MLRLFQKTSWKIKGKVLIFFQQVFSQLPTEFKFLLDGLDNGLYKRFLVNHAMKGNFYSIGFDQSQSDKSMIKGKSFELENIIIKHDGEVFVLNLTIDDGLWIGFEAEKRILSFNDYQVDLSLFKKSKNKFVSDAKIRKLVIGLSCEQLDLTNLGEFEINGKVYYQIKDLEDGNYIAIDHNGQVFGLIHEPYKIEIINKSIQQFTDDVNNEIFDFDKYLSRQNGYS